jgi:hypothetical protein
VVAAMSVVCELPQTSTVRTTHRLPRSIRETVPSSELATHTVPAATAGAAADTDRQAGVAKGAMLEVRCWMGYCWSKKVRTSALKRAGCSMFEE